MYENARRENGFDARCKVVSLPPFSRNWYTYRGTRVFYTGALWGLYAKKDGGDALPFQRWRAISLYRLLSFLFSTFDFFSWQYYQPSTSVFFFLPVKLFLSVKLLIIRNCLLRKNIPSNSLVSFPFFFELRKSYAYEDYNNEFILSTYYIEEYFKRYSMFVSRTTSEGILLSSWILY